MSNVPTWGSEEQAVRLSTRLVIKIMNFFIRVVFLCVSNLGYFYFECKGTALFTTMQYKVVKICANFIILQSAVCKMRVLKGQNGGDERKNGVLVECFR